MIKIAACDDDDLFITSTMKPLLLRAAKISDVQVDLNFYGDSKKLLFDFEKRRDFNIVILDIDMPEIGGKELARKLKAIDSEICIAFMSAYKDEVYSTISIGIDAFIPKDFDNIKSADYLVQLLKNYEAKNPQYELFNVIDDNNLAAVRISINDIYYFSFTNQSVVLHTYSENFTLVERILDKAVKKYLDSGFFKINRRCIISIRKVYEVLETEVVLDNNEKLPISRRNRKELLKAMADYIVSNG